jgi:hypothetical protein
MLDLSKSDNLVVRKNAIRELPKLIELSKPDITEVLLQALGDEELSSVVSPSISRFLSTDPSFRDLFFNSLPRFNDEIRSKIISFVREDFNFTEETIPQLLNVLNSAFEVSVLNGLQLFAKNRKLIPDDQKLLLVNSLLTRLDNSLNINFTEVCTTLLPDLLKFTRTIGDDSTRRLLDIIGTRIFPRFTELPARIQLLILQKIADTAHLAESDQLLKCVYEVFLRFPNNSGSLSQFNISIAEATLWAFRKLAPGHISTASRLIGIILAYSGQPQEFAHAREDEVAREEFISRLRVLQEVANEFVEIQKVEIGESLRLPESSEDERKLKEQQLNQQKLAKRTGNNCQHLTRVLLAANPLAGTLPKAASWVRIKTDVVKGPKRRSGQGFQRGRRSGPQRR